MLCADDAPRLPPLTSAAEEINKRPDEYWTLVMDIARKNNLKRILRCTQVPCDTRWPGAVGRPA